MKKTRKNRIFALFISAAMVLSCQTPLLSELNICIPSMVVHADEGVDASDITIGGVDYSFPDYLGVNYSLPQNDNIVTELPFAYPPTLKKTAENAYTLTLNGGTISDTYDDPPIRVNDENVTLTINKAGYTVINCKYSSSAIEAGSVIINGKGTLEVMMNSYGSSAISADSFKMESGILYMHYKAPNYFGNILDIKADNGFTIEAPFYQCEQKKLSESNDEIYERIYYTGKAPYNIQYSYSSDDNMNFLRIDCNPFGIISGNESIYGVPGQEISPQTITLTLGGCTFNKIDKDEDITKWFRMNNNYYIDINETTAIPNGITAIVAENVAEGASSMKVKLSGKTTESMNELNYYVILIPKGKIKDYEAYEDLTVYADKKNKIFISDSNRKATIPGKTVIEGECFKPLEETFTVNLSFDSFSALGVDTVVKDWFTNLPKGLDVKLTHAVSSGDKYADFKISGTLTKGCVNYMLITIPGEALTSETALELTYDEDSIAYYDIPGISILPGYAEENDKRYNNLPVYSEDLMNEILKLVNKCGNTANRYYYAQENNSGGCSYMYFFYENGKWNKGTAFSKEGGRSFYFIGGINELSPSLGRECNIIGTEYDLPFFEIKPITLNVPYNENITGNVAPHTITYYYNESTEAHNFTLTLNGGTINGNGDNVFKFKACEFTPPEYRVTINVAEDTTIDGGTLCGLISENNVNISFTGSKDLIITGGEKAVTCSRDFNLSNFNGRLIMKATAETGAALHFDSSYNMILPEACQYKTAEDSAYIKTPFDYNTDAAASYLEFNNKKPFITGVSITADDSFKVNVYYDREQFGSTGAYAGCKAYIEYKAVDEEETHKTSASEGLAITGEFEDVTRFAAKELGDKIELRIVAVDGNEKEIQGEWVTFSVESYLKTLINNPSHQDVLKTLYADILNYGAAAQTYFGHNTGALINADSEYLVKSTPSTTAVPLTTDFENMGSDDFGYYGTSLLLRDRIIIRNYISAEQAPADCSGTRNIGGKTYYYYDKTGIGPKDFDTVYDFNCNGISGRYSVNYYIARASENGSDSLKNLVKMLYYYGLSAEAYNNNHD